MAEVKAPTKLLNWEDFYKVSKNGDTLMDRVWYCLASSEKDV